MSTLLHDLRLKSFRIDKNGSEQSSDYEREQGEQGVDPTTFEFRSFCEKNRPKCSQTRFFAKIST
jgi:hypothetical protein